MISLPAGVDNFGMPFGLGIMNTAWSEVTLIKYASAIEDLQLSGKTKLKRTKPYWLHFDANLTIPVSCQNAFRGFTLFDYLHSPAFSPIEAFNGFKNL